MQMTNEEIIKSYKEAKDKKKQIKILADLNTCDANIIKEILIEAGEAAPRVYKRAAKKPEEKKTAKTAEQELPTAIIKTPGGQDRGTETGTAGYRRLPGHS